MLPNDLQIKISRFSLSLYSPRYIRDVDIASFRDCPHRTHNSTDQLHPRLDRRVNFCPIGHFDSVADSVRRIWTVLVTRVANRELIFILLDGGAPEGALPWTSVRIYRNNRHLAIVAIRYLQVTPVQFNRKADGPFHSYCECFLEQKRLSQGRQAANYTDHKCDSHRRISGEQSRMPQSVLCNVPHLSLPR